MIETVIHRDIQKRCRVLAIALGALALAYAGPAAAGEDPLDTDRDGLADVADPCVTEPRNLCFGPVALTLDGLELRINAGRSDRRCNDLRWDCAGAPWSADFASTRRGRLRRCLAREGCRIRGVRALFGCVDGGTKALFRCSRGSRAREPGVGYALPVPEGRYLVNLLFVHAVTEQAGPAARVFDIRLEGELVYDDFDLSAVRSGGVIIRSAFATVIDQMLEIELERVAGNPVLSAIEVLAAATTTTTLPACRADGDCSDGLFCNGAESCNSILGCVAGPPPSCDDGLACTRDTCSESRDACVRTTRCAEGLACAAMTGRCVLDAHDGDSDGLVDGEDPCPTDPRNRCFGVVAEDIHSGLPIRINVGATAHECAGGKRDCVGEQWTADFGASGTPASGACNLPDGCAIAGLSELFGCQSEATEDLFQCERWAESTQAALAYAFAVDDGEYLVNLFFANTYTGTRTVGSRTFDIFVEGAPAYLEFDQVAAAGGSAVAVVRSVVTHVSDGVLDIVLARGVENPAIKAIEVLAAPVTTTTTLPSCAQDCTDGLSLSPRRLSWGHVPVGASGGAQTIFLYNGGAAPVHLRSLSFAVGRGAAHDFHVRLAGQVLSGAHGNVSHPLDLELAPEETVLAEVEFAPTESESHEVSLVFATDTATHPVEISATAGAGPAEGFLHAVIAATGLVIDYDADGFERVALDGSESHTHEPGRRLNRFEWAEGGVVFATGTSTTRAPELGPHTITLTIYDDAEPPASLATTAEIEVVTLERVPGALALTYVTDGDPAGLLDASELPAAVFAEVREAMTLVPGSGAAPASSAMVRLQGRVELVTSGLYTFRAWGGSATRLLVDGDEPVWPAWLEAGVHDVEARFALSGAPEAATLAVTVTDPSGALVVVRGAGLTHDQTGLLPVLNAAPAAGSESGGEEVALTGLGFFPRDGVSVHWGEVTLGADRLRVEPSSIRLTTPAGTGTVTVRVETAAGTSNAREFRYLPTFEPVQFSVEEIATLEQPTQAEWGPDGRLYVASLGGRITAYRFNDDYRVIEQQVIDTLVGSEAPDLLGLAFDPADGAEGFGLYVAHSRTYARGGRCDFSGEFPYIGRVSRLRAPAFDTVEPVVTGLPTSNHDHAVNGLVFDDHGDLLIAVGGNTNAGVPSCNLGGIPESPLSAAVLRAELARHDFAGEVRHRDRDSGAPDTDQRSGDRAEIARGTDVHVLAAGLRNAFDLALTTSGALFCADNGPDLNLGPASTGPDTEGPAPHPTEQDTIDRIVESATYGHPNRNRGRLDPRQDVYRAAAGSGPGTGTMPALWIVPSSANGLVEYRADTFGGVLRGQLIVQKWNGKTMRLRLSADAQRVEEAADLPVSLESLDLTTGPGGVLIGADLSENRLVIARPIENPQGGLAVHDVHPWRAPIDGGARFVIAGRGFTTIEPPVVRFGEFVAEVSAATPTRIHGIVPARAGLPAEPVDITVSAGAETRVLTRAFRYLPSRTADRGAACDVVIDPGGNIASGSTYTPRTFRIENFSSAGQQIERVRLDLRGTLLRDLAFDPDGLAGDPVGKGFTVDEIGATEVAGHALLHPRNGGYDVLEIEFARFPPGATFAFSVDVDPTSIRGEPAPGPGAAGSVSGLELAGTGVTVTFDDGTLLRGEAFRLPQSLTGSAVRLDGTNLPRPTLELIGPSAVTVSDQTVRVHAPVGSQISVLIAEAARFVGAQGGFDLQPGEANSLLAVSERRAAVGDTGYVDVPVTLTRSAPEGGWNTITAVVLGERGENGRLAPAGVIELLTSP